MMEKIKTVVLWVLILTSVVLTYLIWTYQPYVGTIEHPEYFTSDPIGEERTFFDVLQPRNIIIHEDDEIYELLPHGDVYKQLVKLLQNVEFTEFVQTSNLEAPSLHKRFEGIEIIFPNEIKDEWIKELLAMEEDDYFPLSVVDRIYVLLNRNGNEAEIKIRFISFTEEVMYEVNTNISEKVYYSIYEEYENQLIKVRPITFTKSSSLYKKINYVPSEKITLKEYMYYSETLSQESFKHFLFNDPEFVKRYFQGNLDETYTDGRRMMNIVENGTVLRYYIHPFSSEQDSLYESTIMDTSLDFINSHAGWTDQYFFDEFQETSFNEQIIFRMNVNGLPVMRANSYIKEYYMMELTQKGNQITEYNRSLLHLTEEVFVTDVEIPTYEVIENIIQYSDRFEWNSLEDLTIGYFMRKQGSFIIFEPGWFVKDRGVWKHVDPEREVEENGLE